jgi:hypothetical protein
MDFGASCACSESTNACPIPPTPGGSVVPRANTTSTSGHPAAAARGMLAGELAKAEIAAAAAAIEQTI